MFFIRLTSAQRHMVYEAWLNFETAVKQLPRTESTHLLVVHARRLLDELTDVDDNDDAAVDIGAVHLATTRVNTLMHGSPLVLGIRTALTRINHVLVSLIQGRHV